jgi:hypothetical protein
MTQLMRTIKHQTLKLIKTDDSGPEVLRDHPTILIKTTKHNKLVGLDINKKIIENESGIKI